MPKATLAGHPLHPQLIVLPAGLLPFSLAMDVMNLVTGRRSYADAAYYSMAGGLVGGLVAGAAGAADYFSIPPRSQTKKIANLHAVLNLGLLGLTGVNLLLRRRRKSVGILPVLLSAAGNAGVLVSSWYGGHMVYEHGLRVKGVSEIAEAPEIKPPGDERIVERLNQLAEKVAPEGGPSTQESRSFGAGRRR